MKLHKIKFLMIICLIYSISYAKDMSIIGYFKHPTRSNLKTFQSEDTITKNIITIHNENNGSTYNIRWGNLNKKPLYIVSLYPELGKVYKGQNVERNALEQFVESNIHLLLNPRCVVGTWYNKDDNKTYLDVSAVFFDKEVAIKLAKKYNQIAIWDLENSEQINTGGNGKPIKNLPHIEDRIPNF